MNSNTKLSQDILNDVRCPRCKSPLTHSGQGFACKNGACGEEYPIVSRVPVIIDETASIFSFTDFTSGRDTYFSRDGVVTRLLRHVMPVISNSVKSKQNYAKLSTLLKQREGHPRILVLGGSIVGVGMEVIIEEQAFEFVETDVSFGPRTMMICDAHSIPFADGTFDAVIAQAVLEHVADPYKCVSEIHRVLKKDGLVYAETPFMQQVHGRQYDFTRFTHLGHRRLFRSFVEIESGAVCGPGMALAWSYQYFLLSFFTSKRIRLFVRGFAALTAFFLKYIDYFLIRKRGALDAASGYYFTGRKSERMLPDKELLTLYRGAF